MHRGLETSLDQLLRESFGGALIGAELSLELRPEAVSRVSL